MAIQYNFLKPIDQKVRDQGYDFVSQDEYLQDGFKPTSGISYAGDGSPVSYANSGIMTQAPYIYPPINQGGGDGGEGPPGPPDDDEEDDGGWQNDLGGMKPGKGTLGSNLKNVFGFLSNPIGYLGYKGYGAFKQAREIQKQKEFYDSVEAKTVSDMARGNKESNTGGYQAGYGNDFMDGPQGAGRGNKSSDKGGSDTMGSHADGGRVGYFFGGRVNYKAGGRTDAESQYGADSVGSYDSSANQSDRGQSYGINNNPPVSTEDNNKIVTTDFINKNPSLTVDYTDPKNYASVYGKIGFNNILDNDDLTAKGNVTGQIGKFGYNTNFTDQGITGTNLTAGNVSANISPDMQLENLSYSKGPFRISSDGQNTRAGLTFSYKNGGLAGLL